MRQLFACVNHPIIVRDEDGKYKLVVQAGYHEETKVYINGRKFDANNESFVTALNGDLATALDTLELVFGDFPYKSKTGSDMNLSLIHI